MGERPKALHSFKRALALTRKGQDQRYEAYSLNYLGRTYERSGQKEKARASYQQALPLNQVASDPAGESLTLFNLAHLERDLGNLSDARAWIERAHGIIETLRTKSTSHDLRAAYFASVRQHYELYIDILMQLHKKAPAEGFDTQAFQESEKARARSLLESLGEAKADIRQGVDGTLLEKERSLQQTMNMKAERYAQLRGVRSVRGETEAVARDIDRLTIEYDEVKAQIRSKSPHYAALTLPQPLTLKAIQQQVLEDDNSMLLEYALGDERSYLWAVTRTEVRSYQLPGREEIEKAAKDVYSGLIANQALPDENGADREARVVNARKGLPAQIASLSRILLGPVASRLGTKRLLVVADGALQYIPFQILTVSAGTDLKGFASELLLKPLVVDHEIVNEPSASTLAMLSSELKHRRAAPNSVAVFADPIFEPDDPRLGAAAKPAATSVIARVPESDVHRAMRDVSFSNQEGTIPRLLASRAEANAIMSVAPWRSGFAALGFSASRETALKTDLGQYRIVHFATHGVLNDKHPELSGIVLSLFDEKGQPQDGFLRLHDVYNLKLPVELVVLSACNTGLGKDVKGEGLIGLTRGFMYAGASSVVASLWKVDDEATAELMRLFYGYMLRDGLSPAAALRKAQVTMSQQKRWQSPYYWAGFVIQGQYLPSERVNRFSSRRVVPWLMAAAFVSAAAFYALRRRRKIVL
jgi:CHAT domain-containing protein